MKLKLIYLIFLLSTSLIAQTFRVNKITGNVYKLSETSEKFIKIKEGDTLKGTDLISTDQKSFIQLSKDGNSFLLSANSALELDYIKKISINELLLRLAMEEIRNIPNHKNNSEARNTAVYGSEIENNKVTSITKNLLGEKKINGAKQLAKSGYEKSAILAAKETFRKYPATATNFSTRIYFLDIIIKLNLAAEAATEINEIAKLKLTSSQKKILSVRIDKIKSI